MPQHNIHHDYPSIRTPFVPDTIAIRLQLQFNVIQFLNFGKNDMRCDII